MTERTIYQDTAKCFDAAYAFGVVDAKGRALGCRVSITFEPASWVVNPGDDAHRWHGESHDARFSFSPQATRDGKAFGAVPVRAWAYFGTLAAARAHAAKYVAGARKRAEKVSIRAWGDRP